MSARRLARAAAAGLAAAAALPLAAAEPRSAIPWLSQSLHEPAPVTRPAPRPLGPPRDPSQAEIAVTPLEDVSRDAVGLLPPESTGFSRALWGPTSALRVRGLILDHADRGVPEARAVFRRVLLAEADPPPGSGAAGSLLVARIDRLLEIGALEEADALIAQAGADTPELFRRWFDVGLLLDRAGPACEALQRNPALSPTLPARIFCLARSGDWNAAEITLTLGRNVGEVTEDEELALARFLDAALFEEEPDPGAPDPLTPLDFLLREAVGLPRPPGPLPAAFLHADLVEFAPMRARIMAGERLVLKGGVAAPVLFDAYRAGRPAASGGLWDRAAAVQALDAALEDDGPGRAEALAEALVAADAALAERGLRVALADEYGEALAALAATAADALPAEARATLVELLLLAGLGEAAAAAAGAAPEPRDALLLALAGEGSVAAGAAEAAAGPRARAAVEGLAAAEPPDDIARRLAEFIDEGREGEAILAALDLVAEGVDADPPALRAALFALGRAGQETSARRIALQTLLLPDAAG